MSDPRVPPGQPRGRTGTEPATARSPLRLRLALALLGALFAGAVAVGALTAEDRPGWLLGLGVVLGVLAVVGLVDALVVSRRIARSRG
ncbi:DUF6343 family protein [Vallicoccus soli]|uniref:Uncharacterized protein n=1 Tax=Vallicoccus soli TaxID=2339232 RepID=A0A3A3Z1F5_9ACTN|nr:DUF6343 family protein [Vallicoccus soli]RJK98079.1 hypothetical protein D5H78_03865 [Vallicoccus soli]